MDSGKFAGGTFSFKITVDGSDYPHAGTIGADTCTVNIDFGGQSVETTLERDSSR